MHYVGRNALQIPDVLFPLPSKISVFVVSSLFFGFLGLRNQTKNVLLFPFEILKKYL